MKKLIKTIILLTTIFSLCLGFSAIAGIEQSRVSEGINGCECSFWELKSETPQGNYTLLQDYSEHSILVHTSQWNEYKLLVSQGSPEVIDVWGDEYSYEYEDTDYFKGFYLITGYRLKGQKNVNLPKDKYIKITDPYNCDHLSILKYLGKTLDSNILLDVNKYKAKVESKVKEDVEKKYGTAEERAKKQAEQQAEAKADQQILDKYKEIKDLERPNGFISSDKIYKLRDKLNSRLQELSLQSIEDLHNVRKLVQKYLKEKNRDWGWIPATIDEAQGTKDDSWDDWIKNWLRERGGKMNSTYNQLLFIYPGQELNGKPVYGKTNLTPAGICQKSAHGYFLTNENYDKFETEALELVKECYQDYLKTYPDLSSFELAKLTKSISNSIRHYGDKVDAYVINLVKSTAVSEEDKKELEKLKKEAEELEQELRGSDSWEN